MDLKKQFKNMVWRHGNGLKILWEKKIDLQGGRQYDSSIVDKIQKEIMNEQPDILKAVNTNGSRS